MRINSTIQALLVLVVFCNCSKIYAKNFDQKNDEKYLFIQKEIKRSLFANRFLLASTLMTIALKTIVLLPVFLSKIFLLTFMNFISSSLNLVLSAVLGIRKFLLGNKSALPQDQDTNQKIVSVQYEYQPHDVYFAIAKPERVTPLKNDVAYGGQLMADSRQVQGYKTLRQFEDNVALNCENLEIPDEYRHYQGKNA